ncbi:MAG TPA: YgeY family selenium metabolism-linked hydrolase [Elusimicrobia bacterium]|nr:MAG: selenium metabolism hydrolase [Elusimicrobia bacterium GWA2_64_40]OGR67963.1 MAG: selenium metabolism hydrolase [Elusimicrobia bacterium GWB2_63_16]HAN04509.1 YgeY family selenium metabolism-linked hydrolase [Elusimicrobiota bacterium]HAU88747.1 YgeY family selenium metabolism-linked hydrolase [Elusimicrobiota bacterium]
MNNAELIRKAADKYKKDIVAFARNIIRTPSFSTQEGKLVELIKKEMVKVGFDKVKIDAMGNIIGFIGHGKKKIMMDAHIDTVGIGDPKAWKIDPFAGIYKNDTIYGRGATDQKLSMASMVYAGKIIKDLKLEGDYTLMVVGSVMEEDCDGLPLLHIINKEKIRPDFVVITEPTDLKVYRGHRGRMEMKVVTKGRSCHASAPERGDNAVVKMADITKEITALNKKLKNDKFIGKGTVAVTSIECKTPSLNAVPDECTIYLDRRLTIGETLKSSVAEIQRLPSVKKAKAKVEVLHYDAVAWTGLKVGQEKYFPTWVLPRAHKLVNAGVEAGKVALNKMPVVDKWVFSTNGVASAGRLGIPTIGFGPGNEVHAHTVNEFMPAEDLVKAAAFYAALPQYL